MPTEGLTTRVRGSWALGDYLKSSIAALLIGGSLVVGNNVFFTAGKDGENLPDDQENLIAVQSYESGAFIAYQEEPLVASGSHRIMAQFQLTTTAVSSGAWLHRTHVECGDKGNVAKNFAIAATRLPKAGTGGMQIVARHSLGSGGTIRHTTGALVTGGWYLTALSQTGASSMFAGNDCKLKAWYSAKHGS